MKNDQSGFSIIGIAIILLVIGTLGVAGWQVFQRQDASKMDLPKQESQTTKIVEATDSSQSFTYAYPENWSLQKYIWSDCCEGPQKTEPDWSKQTQPITLKEQSAPLAAAITVDGFGPNAIDRAYESRTQDQFNTYTKLKINGYDALYHVKDFVGPSSAEKYKDHEYIISNADATKSVRLQFRERYSNSTINGESDFDASDLVADFELIAKSIKFQ